MNTTRGNFVIPNLRLEPCLVSIQRQLVRAFPFLYFVVVVAHGEIEHCVHGGRKKFSVGTETEKEGVRETGEAKVFFYHPI